MARQEFMASATKLANLGLATGGGLSLLVFVNFFYRYSWTGERQFSNSLFMILYYGVPFSLAVFLFASLRFKPSQKVDLLVLLIASSLSIYGLELGLEWWFITDNVATKPLMTVFEDSKHKDREATALKKKWGVEIDTRSAGEMIAALDRAGADAVPIITPSNHLFLEQPDGSIRSAINVDGQEVMPLAGVSGRVTLLCNENGQWIHYRSDLHGFNNSDEIWRSDRLQVAVIGDSFAHGYCVPEEKNTAAIVRHRYPATLNLGIAGDGPLLMLATLKEYLPALKPRVVLWFFYEGNDLTDLQGEMRSPLLASYLSDRFTQGAMLARQHDIDRAILNEIPRLRALDEKNRERREGNRSANRLSGFMRLTVLRQRAGLVGGAEEIDQWAPDLLGPGMSVFQTILRQATQQVNGWGGHLVFVYLPEWGRYTRYSSAGKITRNDVLAVVRSLGISLVDLEPVFRAHGDPLSLFPFRRPGHYTEAGYRLVAEEVLKALGQERFAASE
jgi:hypothetical protein